MENLSNIRSMYNTNVSIARAYPYVKYGLLIVGVFLLIMISAANSPGAKAGLALSGSLFVMLFLALFILELTPYGRIGKKGVSLVSMLPKF